VSGARALPRLRHRVLAVLLLAASAAALTLAFVRVAPNRLISGDAVFLAALTSPLRHALWLPATAALLALFAPPRRGVHVAVALASALALALLFALAGDEAARRSAALASNLARVSLGGASGCWC
jgi:osmoprotectant transport system permease protein